MRNGALLVSSAFAFVLAGAHSNLRAEARANARARLSVQSGKEVLEALGALAPADHWSKISSDAVRPLTVNLFGEGVFSIRFTSYLNQQWSAETDEDGAVASDASHVTQLKGVIHSRKGARSSQSGTSDAAGREVSATLVTGANAPFLRIFLRGKSVGGAPRYYRITTPTLPAGEAIAVSRAPLSALSGTSCGAVAALQVSSSTGLPTKTLFDSKVTTTLREATIALESDYRLRTHFRSLTNSEMASVMNVVDSYYRRDMGITFRIVHSLTRSKPGPYPSTITKAERLLTAFRVNSVRGANVVQADIHHLMLGRDLAGDTVGLAYVGTVCRDVNGEYGLSQYINPALSPIITAHEIGHNFGAHHPEEFRPKDHTGIMAAVLRRPFPTSFSAFSIGEMQDYLSSYGSCLADVAE